MIRLAHPDFGDAERAAVSEVLTSGQLIQAQHVEAFEAQVAREVGVAHAIAVSSGTAALHVAYLSLDLVPGEVLFVPSFAWPSAANVATIVGAVPVLVDVMPGTYNIDPRHLETRIVQCRDKAWGRPRLIVPVHQFGLMADLEAVTAVAERYGLTIVEDAACALGASRSGCPAGSTGQLAIFSFHPRKSITTGEGGVIVTNDNDLAERCRRLRNHGQGAGRHFHEAGLNYRMTEMQAAIGHVQMTKLTAAIEHRRALARVYLEELSSITDISLPDNAKGHSWQTFMVVLPKHIDRQSVIDRMSDDHDIEVGIGSVDAHSIPLYRERREWCPLSVSDLLARSGLALPMHVRMSIDDARLVSTALARVLASV